MPRETDADTHTDRHKQAQANSITCPLAFGLKWQASMSSPRPKKRHKGPRAWNPGRGADEREAGADLLVELLSLYSRCKLNALDFCRLCKLAHDSGVRGASFELYGYDGENAQRHLDSIFPSPGELMTVPVPMTKKRRSARTVEQLDVRVLWSSLEYEIEQNPEMLHVLGDSEEISFETIKDIPAYSMHPLVQEAKQSNSELPIPLSMYIDGVAFITAASGRSESVNGVWIVNELSGKRHFVTALKSGDACRCGCKGHCSMFPILENVRWQLEFLQKGRGPPIKYLTCLRLEKKDVCTFCNWLPGV